jgi:hypothetical protein
MQNGSRDIARPPVAPHWTPLNPDSCQALPDLAFAYFWPHHELQLHQPPFPSQCTPSTCLHVLLWVVLPVGHAMQGAPPLSLNQHPSLCYPAPTLPQISLLHCAWPDCEWPVVIPWLACFICEVTLITYLFACLFPALKRKCHKPRDHWLLKAWHTEAT